MSCILWPGRCDRNGYGIISVGEHKKAHRLIYTLFVGPIPPGMVVMHSCDTPGCVNPAHLSLGTPAENSADCVSKGRNAHGDKAPNAKLTNEQAELIRSGLSARDAMARFGIRKSAYYAARSGQTYTPRNESAKQGARK